MAKARAHWKKRRQTIGKIVGDPVIYDRLSAAGDVLATVCQSPGGWIATIGPIGGEDSFGPYGEPELAKQSVVKRLARATA